MSPLRRRMIEDMQIRNLTLNTQRVYAEQVGRFARHHRLLRPAPTRDPPAAFPRLGAFGGRRAATRSRMQAALSLSTRTATTDLKGASDNSTTK
jgi:hypothetical protein